MGKSLIDKVRQIARESSKRAKEKSERERNENSRHLDFYLKEACRRIISEERDGRDCYIMEIGGKAPFIKKLCKILNREGFKAEYSRGYRSGSTSRRDDCCAFGGYKGSSGYDYVNLWVTW